MAKFPKLKIFSDTGVGIMLTLVFVVLALIQIGFIERMELVLYDFRAGFRQNAAATKDVAIVAIDDESLTRLGRWPWPRYRVADMITYLKGAGAKVIGLTILFSEPEESSGLKEVRGLISEYETLGLAQNSEPGLQFYTRLQNSLVNLDNDSKLLAAVQQAGNVVLPVVFDLSRVAGKKVEIPDYLHKHAYKIVKGTDLATLTPIVGAGKVFAPLPGLAQSALGLGYMNIVPDPQDGVVRRELLTISYGEDFFPSFALQLAAQYLDLAPEQVMLNPGANVALGNIIAPTNEQQDMYITFNGPRHTFPYYPYYEVIEDKIDKSVFAGKVVLIGATAQGLYDAWATPASAVFPGVEIIANVMENLIHKNFITRPSWAGPVEFLVLILFGVYCALLLPRLKAGVGAVVSLALGVAFFVVTLVLFSLAGIWMKSIYPLLLLAVSYGVVVSRRFHITERLKDRVEADSAETNKLLGLSFQQQGLLDLAFEKFRKCALDDEMKANLYNLGLDYERKRQFNKAVSVYEHIGSVDLDYKDVSQKIEKLKEASSSLLFGLRTSTEGTIMLDSGSTRPTLGRYEIIKELGRGAMGVVYKGIDPKINREVAIKTVQMSQDMDEKMQKEMRDRFFREAESAGKLHHPNIVTIYDVGEEHDLSYIAMELLQGRDLEDYGKPGKLLPAPEVLRIVADVADALDFAHEQGVVHRDIKPANIMLLKDNSVRVTDFGIARITASSRTQTGVIMGTPTYMSPEQIMGQKVDGRSDLFSLGVVLYELLTGERPFTGDSIATLMYRITQEPYPPLLERKQELHPVLEKIIDKALKKNRDERYQRGSEMSKHLRILRDKLLKEQPGA